MIDKIKEKGLMGDFSHVKSLARTYIEAMEGASADTVGEVLSGFTSPAYRFRGVYPFRELEGAKNTATRFWQPLMRSVTSLQRRQDIFIAGDNEISEGKWVMSMGHFMGLFDSPWLGIRPTGKLISLRYAEFIRIEDGKITETGLFLDLLGFMEQAGCYPLPPSTGRYFVYPGPKNHDGLLFEDAPADEGAKTLELVNAMVEDLSNLNDSGSMGCPPEVLERSWAKDMIWYGPSGIGATYTIPRYQKQHQLPFRNNLDGKKFHGHVCRFAEGNFACFFGWPNLSNRPLGGFLGLPGGNVEATMQVVDVYYRVGDKLSENWVLIDLPWWLKQQGLDIFDRTANICNPSY